MLTNSRCRSMMLYHKTSCCNDFWDFFSICPLYGDYYEQLFGNLTIFHLFFLDHFPYLWTYINPSIFYSFLFPFHHITKHKPISYYRKRIKKCVTIYFFTTGKTKQTVILAMVDLNQFFIFTSEGTPVVPLSRYTPCINNTD